MVFKLEKFVLEGKQNYIHSKKRKLVKNSSKPINAIEFNASGQVIRDRLQILE